MNDHEIDLVHSISEHRDRAFADLIVFAIGIAAEKYPDQIRKSLSNVFNLSSVTHETKRITIGLRKTFDTANQMANQVRDLEQRMKELETSIETASFELQQLRTETQK